MRLYVYSKNGKLDEVLECSNLFRKDGSFKTFGREAFEKAKREDLIVIFTPMDNLNFLYFFEALDNERSRL